MTDQQQSGYNYEDYMNAGHAAAWDQDWETAVQAYSMAIRMRADEPSAYNSLGLSLLQLSPPRLQEALRVYQRAHDLDPDDPLPLEKSADVYERMGQLEDAAKQYLAVAEAYLARHDLEKAIGNWERATRVTPGLVRVHQKLALAYERIGDKKQAVREYLTLAANFQRTNRTDIAIQAVERALRLEPRNPQSLNMLQALRSGGELIYADERLKKDDEDIRRRTTEMQLFDAEPEIAESNANGPIGEAVEIALEQLAIAISDSDLMMNPSAMDVIQAIEYHRVEAVDEAIAAYQRSEKSGINHPSLHLALGTLLLEREDWQDSVVHLAAALSEKSVAAGGESRSWRSLYAIG